MQIRNYLFNPFADKISDSRHATVYRALNVEQNQIVALKVSNNPVTESQRLFIKENLNIATQLNHPNICKLYEAFIYSDVDSSGKPFERFVTIMEFVDGESLCDFIKYNILTKDEINQISVAILLGLDNLHRSGLLHYNLKPSNILLHFGEDTITAKITDYGIVKIVEADSLHEIYSIDECVSYMAAEQLKLNWYPIDPYVKMTDAMDIWSFGAILYQLITSNFAFDSENRVSIKSIVDKILFFDPYYQFRAISIQPYLYIIEACLEKTVRRPNAHQVLGMFKANFSNLFKIQTPLLPMEDNLGVEFIPFTDTRDNKEYKTVKIGNQVWLAENFAFKPKQGNFWAYNNDETLVKEYGLLYDWQTANEICPKGWHLPSYDEWIELYNSLKDDGNSDGVGIKLKSSTHFRGGKNSSGFTAIPSGYYNPLEKAFLSLGVFGMWWSSISDLYINEMRVFSLDYHTNSPGIGGGFPKDSCISVRYVKNEYL